MIKLTKRQSEALCLFAKAYNQTMFAGTSFYGFTAWTSLDVEMIPNPEPLRNGPLEDDITPVGETTIPLEFAKNDVVQSLLELRLVEPDRPTDRPWNGPLRLSKEGKVWLMQHGYRFK